MNALARVWVALGVLFALGGGTIAVVSALARGGTFGGVLAGVIFVAVPVALALLVKRIVRRASVAKAAIHATFVLGLVVMVVALRFRLAETRAAFSSLGAESDAGAVASASPGASASGSASAPTGASAAASGGSAAPSPERFSFGDAGYTEPDCELSDVTALEAAHGALRPSAEGLARARYPMGLAFLQAQTDAQLDAWYKGAPSDFGGVASRFDVAVHEGSHLWIAKRFDPATYPYPVRGDLVITTKRLTNFHRDAIVARHLDAEHDPYAKIYLSGASGAQGFNTLLDEYDAYTHSLASRYCTRDLMTRGTRVSARDGILTMMYYVETYLLIAREEHAADYAAILADPGHRQLILTVWARAELWLRRSAGEASLGIDDAKLEEWVYEPARLAEIARVRDAPGGAARDR